MRLRKIREDRARISLEAAARITGISDSTLYRMETGKRRISTEEVAMVTTAYGVSLDERQEIIQFVKSGDPGGWWEKPLPGVPEEMGTLASYESEALTLTDWAVMLIPGLLQVESYARALLASDGVGREDADLRWIARKRRQRILGTKDYTAFIYETALRLPFGGRQVHREQLKHLYGARDRGIGLRVLRADQAVSLLSHSWLYMTFPNVSPVVNVEMLSGGVYLQDDRVDPYTGRLRMLDTLALSVSETQTMLGQALKEM
jgi:transcriptional regulator with XRE-family HTH domain